MNRDARRRMPQFRFAEIIRQAEDQTLLNSDFLDGGFYFAADVQPSTRFFCTLNNDLQAMREEMSQVIADGCTEFLVVRGQKLKNGRKYHLVDEASMKYEGREWRYYLYQRFK